MPFANQRHIDQLLSQVSVKYQNKEFIAKEVFPTLPVKKDSDLYRVYDRNFRLPETARADGAKSNQHLFEVSSATYVLELHSLHDFVSDSAARNYDIADLRADVTEELSDKIDLRLEKSVADLFTSTGWSLNVSLSAAQQWSGNTVTSNPIPIFDTGASVVLRNSGFMPNFGIMPHDSMIPAKNHQSVLDRIKYTSKESNPTVLAALFGLPQLLIPKASLDTSALGATESISALWGENCFVGYKPPRPSPRAPSCGYIFEQSGPRVKRWREENRESDAIEVQRRYQAKIVASLAGYLIKDPLA